MYSVKRCYCRTVWNPSQQSDKSKLGRDARPAHNAGIGRISGRSVKKNAESIDVHGRQLCLRRFREGWILEKGGAADQHVGTGGCTNWLAVMRVPRPFVDYPFGFQEGRQSFSAAVVISKNGPDLAISPMWLKMSQSLSCPVDLPRCQVTLIWEGIALGEFRPLS
jgi:hypothetical protein